MDKINFNRPDNHGTCGYCNLEDEDLWFTNGCYFCWDCALHAGCIDEDEL